MYVLCVDSSGLGAAPPPSDRIRDACEPSNMARRAQCLERRRPRPGPRPMCGLLWLDEVARRSSTTRRTHQSFVVVVYGLLVGRLRDADGDDISPNRARALVDPVYSHALAHINTAAQPPLYRNAMQESLVQQYGAAGL
ncbi:hypothetical protein MTO96_012701 [Rhipicephalus appendiculatus]